MVIIVPYHSRVSWIDASTLIRLIPSFSRRVLVPISARTGTFLGVHYYHNGVNIPDSPDCSLWSIICLAGFFALRNCCKYLAIDVSFRVDSSSYLCIKPAKSYGLWPILILSASDSLVFPVADANSSDQFLISSWRPCTVPMPACVCSVFQIVCCQHGLSVFLARNNPVRPTQSMCSSFFSFLHFLY